MERESYRAHSQTNIWIVRYGYFAGDAFTSILNWRSASIQAGVPQVRNLIGRCYCSEQIQMILLVNTLVGLRNG